MKKYLIIALIALVAYLVFFKKKDETETTTTTQKTEEDEPYTYVPTVTTKTTTQRCPYCGTYGAKVTRTYTDGKVTNIVVECGNKSCPGTVNNGGKSKKFEKTSSVKPGTTNTNQSNK